MLHRNYGIKASERTHMEILSKAVQEKAETSKELKELYKPVRHSIKPGAFIMVEGIDYLKWEWSR